MRKVSLLVGISMMCVLVFAPAALAQGAGLGGEGPCTRTPFEQYPPEVNGCVTTEGLPNPGEAIVYDADTREPIGTLAEVTSSTASATPSASSTPTASVTASQYSAPSLPATGGFGTALALAFLALLVAGGLAAASVVRRA